MFLDNCNCHCTSLEYSDHALTCPIWIGGSEERKLKENSKFNPRELDFFYEEQALIELLQAHVLILNSMWWEKNCSEQVQNAISIAVNVNDTFVPAADAELLPYNQLEALYKCWKYDPEYGVTVWCSLQRKYFPTFSKGGFDLIKENGKWKLDRLKLDNNLNIDKDLTDQDLKEWLESHLGKFVADI